MSFGAVLFVVGGAVGLIAWRAFAMMLLWNWHIPALFGFMPELIFPSAVALMLVLGTVRGKMPTVKDFFEGSEKEPVEGLLDMGLWIVVPALQILVGWLMTFAY